MVGFVAKSVLSRIQLRDQNGSLCSFVVYIKLKHNKDAKSVWQCIQLLKLDQDRQYGAWGF